MSKYITGRFSGRDNVTALPVWDQNVAGRESESGSGSLRNGGVVTAVFSCGVGYSPFVLVRLKVSFIKFQSLSPCQTHVTASDRPDAVWKRQRPLAMQCLTDLSAACLYALTTSSEQKTRTNPPALWQQHCFFLQQYSTLRLRLIYRVKWRHRIYGHDAIAKWFQWIHWPQNLGKDTKFITPRHMQMELYWM